MKVLAPIVHGLAILLAAGCAIEQHATAGPGAAAVDACLSGNSDAAEPAVLEKVVHDCAKGLDSLSTDPATRSTMFTTRGVALRNLGRLSASLLDLDEAVRLDPRSGNARRMRGWTLRQMGRYALAEDEYDKALAIEDHWQAYLSRCVVRLDMDAFDAALEDCHAALSRDRNMDALYFTAWLYNERGDYSAAIPLLEEARASTDAPARIFAELARSYQAVGESDAAFRILEDGLYRFPQDEGLMKLKSELQPEV